ncbi:hypothetical protein ACFT5B_17745 [Luteimicrobium sp. NPDC057192]|uniref:hypothetical protein n=1 Tax=Luteimicrobium sp. NPDC057192 TaxID=3346042 RepID=UPI00364537C5
MPWNAKCPNGGPAGFTDNDAIAAVNAADFTQSVYVNTSARSQATRQAYTYVTVVDNAGTAWTICVVGHIHINPNTHTYTGPGYCYIPGWDDWEMQTPALQAAAIIPLADGGAFPGANRYPH